MLLEHNVEAFGKLETILFTKNECCLVAAPGTGKSRVVMKFVDKYGLKTLVVTSSKLLCQDWGEVIDKLGVRGVTCITYSEFLDNMDNLGRYSCYVFDNMGRHMDKEWQEVIRMFKQSTESFVIGVATPIANTTDVGECGTIFNGNVVYNM